MHEKSTMDARPNDPETPRCKSGPGQCLGTELDNKGDKHAALVGTPGRFCERCTTHIARLFAGALDDWDALATMLGERQTSDTVKVSRTTTPAVPLNQDADAKQSQLLEILDLAAEMIAAELGRDYEPPRNGEAHVTAAVDLITPNLDVLISTKPDAVLRWDRSGEVHGEEPTEYRKTAPKKYVGIDRDGNELDGHGHRHMNLGGADICLELWALHGLVRGMYGGRKKDLRRRMPMPCHGCGAKSLYREYGEDLIKCSNCPPRSEAGRGWTEEQYNRLAGLSRFHLKVKEEDEMRELEEANQRAAAAQQRAVEAEAKLARIAEFAGHANANDLIAVIDQAEAEQK